MKLNVFYNKQYNIDLGLLNKLHPFDGLKFGKVAKAISNFPNVVICDPMQPITGREIDEYVDDLQKLVLKKKGYIFRALEVPKIPLLPFSWLDKKILLPMRWAVAGTIAGAKSALSGTNSWNVGGGFHHASKAASEGFCIYNDIGIAVQQLRKSGDLNIEDKILIIDIDAHHGNGNAYSFMEDSSVSLLDIYNGQIYPDNKFTKQRVNINVPLNHGSDATVYLSKLEEALAQLSGDYTLAFVVAGTDVLASDKLGGFALSIEDCAARDSLVAKKLQELSVPFVVVGGGGYSRESAMAMALGIKRVSQLP